MATPEIKIAQLIRECQAKTGQCLSIGTVESATGGRIADRITNVPGSSDYFKGSIIAYSNEAKIKIVGVKKETIENHGAVSALTAIEMAQRGRKLLNVDICISDTGIAGPTGATPEKPVGLFYLALATEEESLVEKQVFSGNRKENKRDAAAAALDMLKKYLLELINKPDKL